MEADLFSPPSFDGRVRFWTFAAYTGLERKLNALKLIYGEPMFDLTM